MNRKTTILLMSLLVLASSCQSQTALTIASQEAAIDNYILNSHKDKTVVRQGGSNRVVLTLGEGGSIEVGDMVTLALKGYVFTSSPGVQFCQDTVTCRIGSGYLVPGLDSGLQGAAGGEQCYIIFSAKYGFNDKAVGIVPALSALLYDTTVISIEKTDK